MRDEESTVTIVYCILAPCPQVEGMGLLEGMQRWSSGSTFEPNTFLQPHEGGTNQYYKLA
jgi:hypothetical protein